MATSTFMTYLMHGTGTSTVTYSKLCDIKEFPDLGGAPEMLDTTTLSDPSRTYVAGIQETESLTFTTNYDPADFSALTALKGKTEKYAVWFGATESNGTYTPSGANGKFTFEGILDVYVAGGGVNEVRDMTITIAPTTVITFAAS